MLHRQKPLRILPSTEITGESSLLEVEKLHRQSRAVQLNNSVPTHLNHKTLTTVQHKGSRIYSDNKD